MNTDIERQAALLLGTPWLRDGRDPAAGIDCMGLVLLAVQRATGVLLPDLIGSTRFHGWREYLERERPETPLPAIS